jgi:hypothetical protein
MTALRSTNKTALENTDRGGRLHLDFDVLCGNPKVIFSDIFGGRIPGYLARFDIETGKMPGTFDLLSVDEALAQGSTL